MIYASLLETATYTKRLKAQFILMEYEVDTQNWTCTCTVRRTGYPTDEPCKHQHAVTKSIIYWHQT